MKINSKIISIIPARGGSKGLPSKNICLLGGKPLIAWTIEAAQACRYLDRVVVNTDSEHIGDISKEYGAEVPFLRPKELSLDESTTEDVLKHAVTWFEEKENKFYDIILYMQPTDVFRRDDIVNKVVKRLIDNPNLDTVFAACPEHKNYWRKNNHQYVPFDDRGHLPRQIKQHIYREDTGIACATRVSVVKKGQRIGKNVDIIPHSSGFDFVDIHNEFDLWIANKIMDERKIFPNQ